MPSTVLVTGVSRFVGGQVAARLAADPNIDRVLGVDAVPPRRDLLRRMGRAEFVRADLRNPLIAKVISAAKVDTVVHAAMTANGRTMKEMNVIGTMQLLAACQRSATVTRLVVKSTNEVYGASHQDPAMFTERDEPKDLPASGYAKDAVEIEGYIRGFARRRDDVDVTVLRFTNVIGPRINTVLTRYFALPLVPTVLGDDGRMQLLHEEDALAVFERAARERLPGVFTWAGTGCCCCPRRFGGRAGSQLRYLRRRWPQSGGCCAAGALIDYFPEQSRFLDLGRVLDTTRLRTAFGFTPRWTTVQAFDDFVHGRALRPVIDPKQVVRVERGLLAFAAWLR